MKKASVLFLLCSIILSSTVFVGFTELSARGAQDSFSGMTSRIDSVLEREVQKAGAADLQAWLDGALAQGAGVTSDWFVFSIRQYKNNLSFSKYASALDTYVKTDEGSTAVTKQRFALLFIAVGKNRDYITQTVNSTIGEFGIMSWIYGLHLLNNGYTSSKISTAAVVEKLLSLQLPDRGWAVSGPNADVDVTAMALQALAPHYNSNGKVKTAVDAALNLLSQRQQPAGDFVSYGTANSQSTAQVITALSSLGINVFTDTRFIKDGKTLLDGLLKYQLADKSFCHTLADGSSSISATAQALGAFVSVWKMAKGAGSLYVLSSIGTDTTQNNTAPVKPGDSATTPSSGGSATTVSGSSPGVSETATPENTGETTVSTTETEQSGQERQLGEATDTTGQGTTFGRYKKWAVAAIILAAVLSSSILLLTGKGSKKNIIAILLAAAGIIGVLLIVKTAAPASNSEPTETTAVLSMDPAPRTLGEGTVSLYINCVNAVKYGIRYQPGYDKAVPANGVILDTAADLQQGDTVFSFLERILKANGVVIKLKSGYVAGIGGLKEMDCGSSSGWIYSVNGEFPLKGINEYTLLSGDRIAFYYTVAKGDVPGKQDF